MHRLGVCSDEFRQRLGKKRKLKAGRRARELRPCLEDPRRASRHFLIWQKFMVGLAKTTKPFSNWLPMGEESGVSVMATCGSPQTGTRCAVMRASSKCYFPLVTLERIIDISTGT